VVIVIPRYRERMDMVVSTKDLRMAKSSRACSSLDGAPIDETTPVMPVKRKGLELER